METLHRLHPMRTGLGTFLDELGAAPYTETDERQHDDSHHDQPTPARKHRTSLPVLRECPGSAR